VGDWKGKRSRVGNEPIRRVVKGAPFAIDDVLGQAEGVGVTCALRNGGRILLKGRGRGTRFATEDVKW